MDDREGDQVFRTRRFAVLAALCGTVVLVAWVPARLGGFGSAGIDQRSVDQENQAPRGATSVTANRDAIDAPQAVAMTSVANVATADPVSPEPAVVPASVSIADMPTAAAVPPELAVGTAVMSVNQAARGVRTEPAYDLASASAGEAPVSEASLPDSRPTPEARVKLASLFRSDPGNEHLKPVARLVETPNECLVAEICIDDYLWALYERTPKVDTNKVVERVKATVKHKGTTRTVTKTVTKYVVGDFTWKDPIAAQKAGKSLKDYVIGGMDRSFKLKLYRALRAMDAAGLMPGITSAFRDDYRQAIATGNKAASDSSFHGGSRRGGYGHGLAADLVSVRGETRMQRLASSAELWKWIDARERELGIGRPYFDRDPPHVGPIDGKEYIAKRGGQNVQRAELQTKNGQKARLETKELHQGVRNGPGKTIKPGKTSKVSSLQSRTSVQR